MGKENYSQSLAKSRGSADPKRKEFIHHWTVSPNKPSAYWRNCTSCSLIRATIRSRHHGGVHHLRLGLYYDNGAHNQSLEMGCKKRTTTVWSVVTTNMSLYGEFKNTYDNCPLLLEKLHQNIIWARMKIRPSECRSISIVKGHVTDQRFHIGGIPDHNCFGKASEKFGQMVWFTPQRHRAVWTIKIGYLHVYKSYQQDLAARKSQAVVHTQFGILSRLVWHLTMYEIPLSKVEKLERVISTQVKQWLGLPQCLSAVGLYNGKLELPVTSLVEFLRLVMTLTDSEDIAVWTAAPWVTVQWGEKADTIWSHAQCEVGTSF